MPWKSKRGKGKSHSRCGAPEATQVVRIARFGSGDLQAQISRQISHDYHQGEAWAGVSALQLVCTCCLFSLFSGSTPFFDDRKPG